MGFFKRLRGRWRLWWGLCPLCNSDAPALYHCPVCQYYQGPRPIPADLKILWWAKYEYVESEKAKKALEKEADEEEGD